MRRAADFSRATAKLALQRQKNLCASCGEPITSRGAAGRADHRFGEAVHAHHILHVKLGGTNTLDNCVLICESCHYCVHEGGRYSASALTGTPNDFPHFQG